MAFAKAFDTVYVSFANQVNEPVILWKTFFEEDSLENLVLKNGKNIHKNKLIVGEYSESCWGHNGPRTQKTK